MRFFSEYQARLKNTGGYTIDQTILIVAIIAILVTLIILSVGWQLINRTSGTKLASQFKQIEDANGLYYASYRVWPDDGYTDGDNEDDTMVSLAGGPGLTAAPTVVNPRNLIPGFVVTAGPNGNVQHNFSSGGLIKMVRLDDPYGEHQGQHFVVEFQGVPFSEAVEAELAIDAAGDDANINFTTGRIVAEDDVAGDCLDNTVDAAPVRGTTEEGAMVTVCYVANLTQ